MLHGVEIGQMALVKVVGDVPVRKAAAYWIREAPRKEWWTTEIKVDRAISLKNEHESQFDGTQKE